MTVQRDGQTNKQRQIAVISIRMPHFPGNICLFSCIIDFPYFRESHIARIKDTFDPKKTWYVVFHSANKNTLGPALPLFRRSLARANHVSVKVVEGRGVGGWVQQVEILEQFFWIMRVGVTIFRSLKIILKEKVFFDFVFWPSSSSVEVSLDLKALKTLRERAVLNKCGQNQFWSRTKYDWSSWSERLEALSAHTLAQGPGNFFILRHIFLASETRSRPLQQRPIKHRYVFNPRTNFDHGTEFGKLHNISL